MRRILTALTVLVTSQLCAAQTASPPPLVLQGQWQLTSVIREEGSQARLLLQSPEAHGHVLFTEDGTMFLFMGYRVAGHPDPSKRALADFLPHRAVMVGDFVVHGNRLIYTPRISGGPPLFVGQAETREISIPEDGILDLIVNSENAVRWTVRWRRDDADSSR